MTYKENYSQMLQEKIKKQDIQIHMDIILEELALFEKEIDINEQLEPLFFKIAYAISTNYLAVKELDENFINDTDPTTAYIRGGFYAICSAWFKARSDKEHYSDINFQDDSSLLITKTLLKFFNDTEGGEARTNYDLYLDRLYLTYDFTEEELASLKNSTIYQ